MDQDWGVLSLCDIVLNHTSKETGWLRDHPEASYNCSNCPHLRPAFALDQVMIRLSVDVAKGLWVERGIPKGRIHSEEHLQVIMTFNNWALSFEICFDFYNMIEFISRFRLPRASCTTTTFPK